MIERINTVPSQGWKKNYFFVERNVRKFLGFQKIFLVFNLIQVLVLNLRGMELRSVRSKKLAQNF